MRPVATILAVLVGLCGCGVTTTIDRTYNDSLIQQVGAGSTAVKGVEDAIRSAITAGAANAGSATDHAAVLLLRGQLSRLNEQDLQHMHALNQASEIRLDAFVARLGIAGTALARSQVNPGKFASLSAGAHSFIASWNEYVLANENAAHAVRHGFTKARPVFAELERLLQAARDTARLKSTVVFDRLRDRFVLDTTSNGNAFKVYAVQALTQVDAAGKKLFDLINTNHEARAIFDRVNQTYPSGFLAASAKTG
jgi:hypothetical protein